MLGGGGIETGAETETKKSWKMGKHLQRQNLKNLGKNAQTNTETEIKKSWKNAQTDTEASVKNTEN